MFRALLVVSAVAIPLAIQAVDRIDPGSAKEVKKMTTTQLHHVAGEVSVQIFVTTAQGTSIGSGAWITEEYVATCWHDVKNSQGTIKVRIALPTWYDSKNHNLAWGSF